MNALRVTAHPDGNVTLERTLDGDGLRADWTTAWCLTPDEWRTVADFAVMQRRAP